MSTVGNTLKLTDQTTPVLKHILKAMGQTLRVMEEMDSAAQKADFSKQFGLAKHEIDTATKALEEMEHQIERLNHPQEKVRTGFERWRDTLVGVNAALDIARKGLDMMKQGADWVMDKVGKKDLQQSAEVQLAVSMANRGYVLSEYKRMLEQAAVIQGRTMYGDESMIAGAAELSTYLKDAEALAAAMDTLSMYAAGMSGGTELTQQQMVDYATQLGKAFDGQMDGMAKKGFFLTDEQKKFMDTASDLERVVLINDMIAESWAGLDEAYRDNTARGQMAAFMNEYGDMEERLGARMEPALMHFFGVLLEQLPMIENFLSMIATGANTLMYLLASGLEFIFSVFRDGWPYMLSALIVLSTIYLPGILKSLWKMVAPILAQAAGWAAANAPMLMIIAILGIMISAIADTGIAFEDVLGFVGGLFGGLYAFLYNVVVELWNLFATFAEFLANLFHDPLGSIMRLFAGMADYVLGLLQNIASAIDAVFGGNLTDSVAGWRNDLQSMVQEHFGKAAIQVKRMEQMSVASGYASGKQVARDLANKLSGLTDGLNREAFVDNLSWGNEIDHVGSLGRIDEDVSISEEDIKLLKDVAAMEFQLNFTQLTPQLTATFGDIRETADIDEVYDRFVQRGMEELQSSLVYTG